jgi:L-fucose isomerase-like protein
MTTKVHTVFLVHERIRGRNVDWPGPNVNPDHDAQKIKRILSELEPRLGVDAQFVGGETVRTAEDVAALEKTVAESGVDGILAFNLTSSTRDVLCSVVNLGLPTVLFNQPFSGHEWIVIGHLQKEGKRVDVLATSDFHEIIGRVKLFDVIGRLKRTKLLYVWDGGPSIPEAEAIKAKFGVTVQWVDQCRLEDAYRLIPEADVQREVAELIRCAEAVVEPSEQDIRDVCRMYLAIRRLVEEEGAQGMSIKCLDLMAAGQLSAYPCLAWTRFDDQGMVGACEGDLNSALTKLVVGRTANKPGFLTDPVFDTASNTITHAHCIAPTKMDGPDGAAAPYVVRSHAEDDIFACLQVKMRVGQEVTVAQLKDWDTMLMSRAEIVGNLELSRGCRVKVVTKVNDTRKMLENWTVPDTRKKLEHWAGGVHRVLFYGNHIEDITNLGKLLGFRVVRED